MKIDYNLGVKYNRNVSFTKNDNASFLLLSSSDTDLFESDVKPSKEKKSIVKKFFNFIGNKVETINNKKNIRELKSEIPNFIKEQDKVFYSKYHTYDEITDFEEGKQMMFTLSKRSVPNISDAEENLILNKTFENGISGKSIKNLLENNNKGFLTLQNLVIPSFSTPALYYSEWKDLNTLFFKQINDIDSFMKNIKNQMTIPEINLNEIDKLKTKKSNQDEIHFSNKEILSIINRFKDVKLDDSPLIKDKYGSDEFYDFPLKFATASYNSYHDGQKYIKNGIPEIFNDIDEDKLFEMFDLLSFHIRSASYYEFERIPIQKVNIQGIDFTFTPLKRGFECFPIKIFRNGHNPVLLKTYYERDSVFPINIAFAPTSFYGNIGLMYEANKAGVSDVPALYMASPVYTPIQVNDKKSYFGGWAVFEDAFSKKNSSGLKIKDWLREKGLVDFDINKGTFINNFLVDAGFIQNEKAHQIYGFNGNEDLNRIYSRYILGETTQQIIDYLKNSEKNQSKS